MKSGKLTRKHVLGAALAVGVLWFGIVAMNLALVRAYPPLDAVRAKAEEFGYTPEQLTFVGGGYSNAILEWKAYADYRLTGVKEHGVKEHGAKGHGVKGQIGAEERRLHLEIERPTPLHAWHVAAHVIRQDP